MSDLSLISDAEDRKSDDSLSLSSCGLTMLRSLFNAVRTSSCAFAAVLLSAALFMSASEATELELESSGKTRQAALGNLKMSALRNVLSRNLHADDMRGRARELRTEVFEHVNEIVSVVGDVAYREEGEKTYARAVVDVDDDAVWRKVAKIPGLKEKAERILNADAPDGEETGAAPQNGEEQREAESGQDVTAESRAGAADEGSEDGAQEIGKPSPGGRPDLGNSGMNSDETSGGGNAAKAESADAAGGASSVSFSGGYGLFALLLSAAVFLFIMFFFSEHDNSV